MPTEFLDNTQEQQNAIKAAAAEDAAKKAEALSKLSPEEAEMLKSFEMAHPSKSEEEKDFS